MSRPFGTIYLSGVRTPILDRHARESLLSADWVYQMLPLGILIQPLTGGLGLDPRYARDYIVDGHKYYRWAGIDNGCFTEAGRRAFNLDAYLRMIDRTLDAFTDHGAVLFATARDVPFDWHGTLRMSLPMLPLIRRVGAPAALVLQDGATPTNIPWDELDCVFIGGSTEWKISPVVQAISAEARSRRKWVHMGRVNSLQRMRIAHGFGCGSADGTFLRYEGDAGVEQVLTWLRDTWKRDKARQEHKEQYLHLSRALAELQAKTGSGTGR